MPGTGDGNGTPKATKQAIMPTPQAAGTAASRRAPRAKAEEPNLKGAAAPRTRIFSRSMPGAGMQENAILRRVEVPAVGRRPHVFAPPGAQVAERVAARVGFDYPATLRGSTAHFPRVLRFPRWVQTAPRSPTACSPAVSANTESFRGGLEGSPRLRCR